MSSVYKNKPNSSIVFSDIHLLLGAIPAVILPAFGFLGSCTKLRGAEDYIKCVKSIGGTSADDYLLL